MKKYICIDTNIYIQCCLLEIEGDDINALNDLHKLLNNNRLYLLLPDVIELEFYRRLKEKTEELVDSINRHKGSIGEDVSLNKKITKDLIGKLNEVIEERRKTKIKVEGEIQKIFTHKNTIKLPLTAELLVDGYKYFLSNE